MSLSVGTNVHCITSPAAGPTPLLIMDRDVQLQGEARGDVLQATDVFVDSEKTSVLYFGQLKLFIAELEFLTPFHARDDITVLYAGALPGYHILFLADLFPKMRFILVDPGVTPLQTATPSIVEKLTLQTSYEDVMSRITIVNKFLTESDESDTQVPIASLRQEGREMLFISDIRNTSVGDTRDDHAMHQRLVHEDMDLQRRLLLRLDPEQSLLKCRMPWTQVELEDGTVLDHRNYAYLRCSHLRYQVYTSPKSYETRMLVTREDARHTVPYDCLLYEQAMQHFQLNTRRAMHIEPTEDEYNAEIRRLKHVRYVSMFTHYKDTFFVPLPTEAMFKAYEAVCGQSDACLRSDGSGMKRFNLKATELTSCSYYARRSAWLSSLCCCYDCVAFDHVAKQYTIASGLGTGVLEHLLTEVPRGIRLFKWASDHVDC